MTQDLSYVHGAARTPLLGVTIGACFDAAAKRFADREALVVPHQAVRWTYAQLWDQAERLAAGLLRTGLAPGDRVGVWSQNRAEWVVAQFATAKAGLILVSLNPAYRAGELEYALNKVGCRALILAPTFKTSDYLAMLAELAPELAACPPGDLRAARLPDLRIVIRLGDEATPGMLNFTDLTITPSSAERSRLAEIGANLQFDDAINIQFTSGTTGAPKGATLTHHNILNNGFFIGQAMALSEHDRVCIPVPLYHCFGMVIGNLAAITHGAAMIFPGEAFDPASVLETVAAEGCTALHGVPTMFIALLEHPGRERYDLSTLRTGMMAGAPCPIEVMRRVIGELGLAEITIGYGMTETAPISFQGALDDPLERRVGTVGRVHPHVEVKIVDERGHIVPRGTKGELLTRGYSVMLGYWNDTEMTRQAIDPAGWMRTGDLATLDADGYCNIVGRAKDMIIRGGENISPREVEEFLHGHPKVQDVQVVGVPDDRMGEAVCAVVVLRPGARADPEEIRRFCRNQIAHYKIPAHVRFVDAFPMTVSGKVKKYVLRDLVATELGARAVETA